jgi:hypothetical protein
MNKMEWVKAILGALIAAPIMWAMMVIILAMQP